MGGDIVMKDILEDLKENDPQIESVKSVLEVGCKIAACVSDSSTVVQCT